MTDSNKKALKGKTAKTAKQVKSTFKRKRALALPTISLANLKEGESKFFESLADDFRYVDKVDEKTGEVMQENGKPIQFAVLHVRDLVSNKEGEIVCGIVVEKALSPILKNGLKFELVRGRKVNRTIRWEVYEID